MQGPVQDLPDPRPGPRRGYKKQPRVNTNWYPSGSDAQEDADLEPIAQEPDSLFSELDSINKTEKYIQEYSRRLDELHQGSRPDYQDLATAQSSDDQLKKMKEIIIYDRIIQDVKHKQAKQNLELEEKKFYILLKKISFFALLLFLSVVTIVAIYVMLTKGALSESGMWEGLFNLIKEALDIIFNAGKGPNIGIGY